MKSMSRLKTTWPEPKSEYLVSVFPRTNKIECQNKGQVTNGNTKTMSKVEEKSKDFQVLELGDPGSLDSRMLKELAHEIIDLVCRPSHLRSSATSYLKPQQR